MKKIFTHNIGLKLISFLLAVLTWFYIYAELVRTRREIGVSSFDSQPVRAFDVNNVRNIK